MEVSKLHVICFCASVVAGINEQDILSIKLLIEHFRPAVSKNSCLIVTRCESKDEEQCECIRKELMMDIDFREIASFFQLGIYFSDAINRDNYGRGNYYRVEEQFEIILKY